MIDPNFKDGIDDVLKRDPQATCDRGLGPEYKCKCPKTCSTCFPSDHTSKAREIVRTYFQFPKEIPCETHSIFSLLVAALEAERKVGREEGQKAMTDGIMSGAEERGYRRGLEEAAKYIGIQGWIQLGERKRLVETIRQLGGER